MTKVEAPMGFMMKNFLLAQVSQKTGKSGLSRSYLFDRTYADHRSGVILGSNQRLTVLSYLLRHLDECEREALFPGQFDLGNRLQPVESTTEALLKEIRNEGYGESEHSIRVIKEKIEELTGIHFTTFFQQDKGKTLKIVKLLYLLKTKNPVRIFSLLEPPEGDKKPSLEVKNAYPLKGNEKAAYLMADLKAHLALEITPARLKEIDVLFDQLRPTLDSIIQELMGCINSACHSNYEYLLRLLDVVKHQTALLLEGESAPAKLMPLDETLYIHCYVLEFLHFAKVNRYIISELAPNIVIEPIGPELRALSSAIQGKRQVSTNDQCISMSDFVGFTGKYEMEIRGALTKAMGGALSPKDYAKAVPHANKLLKIWAFFHHTLGIRTVDTDFLVNPLMALATVAAIGFEFPHPTSYYPYWLGQKNDRGNVISALNKIDLHSANSTVPEEYIRYWDHRLRWFQYALAGQLDALQGRYELTQCFVSGFESAVKTRDIELIRRRLIACAKLPQMLFEIPS
jgi:aspartate carbamoyltransferase regulatory subunit